MWENDDWEDVDWDDLTDDEIEKRLEEDIDPIAQMIEEDENGPVVVDKKRIKDLAYTYAIMRYLAHKTHAEVTYEAFQFSKTSGCVSVEGKSLDFDPKWFTRAASVASNMEAYALVKNRVRVTFTFNDLAKSVSDERESE